MPITHAFVSGKSDGGDTSLVRPSNWNAAHTLPTHNETSSKQGGTESPSAQYYHLSEAQYNAVVAGGFTDSITLGGSSNTTSFMKLTHVAGADIDTFQLIEYVSGYSTYPNNVTIQMSETGVNRDRLKLKATDDMSGFMLSLRMSAEGVSRPYVSFSHPSSSTDCPVMCFNMWAGQTNPCIQFADSNYVSPPMSAPPYSQVVSGAKGSRTYYLKTTYVTATGETTPCALVGPISMDANKLLRIVFPPAPDSRITDAKVYIHTSSGSLYWQDTVAISAYATTTWTETTGALNTSGPTPPTTNSTGGVQFTMSSVYHGIGFYMKGVGSQVYNYVQINNSSDTPIFRITNSDAVYVRSNTFHVYNASGSTVFYTTSSLAIAYVTFQANAGINLVNAGANTINATQGSVDITAQTNVNIQASENIVLDVAINKEIQLKYNGTLKAKVDTSGFYCTTMRVGSVLNLTTGGSIAYDTPYDTGNDYKHVFSCESSERLIISLSGVVIASGSVVAATAPLDVVGNTIRLRTSKTPASASAAGNAGDICWDTNYIYVGVGTNTWKRAVLSTW